MLTVLPFFTMVLFRTLSPQPVDVPIEKNVNTHVVGVNSNYAKILNVKQFGAKGDGRSDDSKAINKVLDMAVAGQTVYFPSGNYLIGDALIVRNKQNVTVSGDGNASRLFVDNQQAKTGKTTFYTTLSIDECSNVILQKLCIESKGENWGDADAAGKFAEPDKRVDWMINKGGHAVLITRSKNISINNVTARFCGSTGVYYASSSDLVTFNNCFANAASLGYAGFAIDNFANGAAEFMPGRRYIFNNCKVNAESQKYGKYAAKGGVVMEGDMGRALNCTITGGEYRDCYTGGNAQSLGAAISAENTNLVATNVKGADNYVGLRLVQRGEINNPVNITVSQSTFVNNKYCGIYLSSASKGGGTILIDQCTFSQLPVSVWNSSPSGVYNKTSGIINASYMVSVKLKVTNSSFTGGNRYVYAADKTDINVNNSRFSGTSDSTMSFYGGGDIDIQKNTIDGYAPIFVRQYDHTRKHSAPVSLNVMRNKGSMPADLVNTTEIPASFMKAKKIDGNIFSAVSGRASQPAASVLSSSALFKQKAFSVNISQQGLQAQNTFLVGSVVGQRPAGTIKSVRNSNGEVFQVLQLVCPFNGDAQKVKIVLPGDIRKSLTPGSTIDLGN
ncbi:glycosyl hydrolase family 28-related protein [Chitinophaga sp. 22321]|uniref:Right-handed parallel beta-helix repeat-containing protein n=1 Tax=Chitinophaga hostae TaxID=2831022 RepID=A0ABS5J1T7_9BACT|nr:glycosyl hydrolase family 28-related protein [Chitinophaga hostae]MBS0028532.1 right-handed parallel beta-helix repeat-containing protein [Chitinophaga hostae]